MITFRQINTNYPPHYFFDDMINIKHFDPSLLDIYKIPFKSTDDVTCSIRYITVKSLDNDNGLYLIFNNVNGYIKCNSTEESNKHLILASTDKNKKVLEKYTELWDEIKKSNWDNKWWQTN